MAIKSVTHAFFFVIAHDRHTLGLTTYSDMDGAGPSPATIRKRRQRVRVAALEETAEAAGNVGAQGMFCAFCIFLEYSYSLTFYLILQVSVRSSY